MPTQNQQQPGPQPDGGNMGGNEQDPNRQGSSSGTDNLAGNNRRGADSRIQQTGDHDDRRELTESRVPEETDGPEQAEETPVRTGGDNARPNDGGAGS